VSEHGLSSRALWAVVYVTAVAALYFSLGVVADRALGLTPIVFLVAGGFFALTALTYVEGASLHRQPGGSTNFARYAFNELVSFVSGWAVALDYVIVVAVCALTATNYLATFWSPLGHGAPEILVSLGVVAFAAVANVRGVGARRLQGRLLIAAIDLGLQALVVVIGLVLVFRPGDIAAGVDLGTSPTWQDLIFAVTIAVIAFTGLEAAAGLAAETRTSLRSLKLLVGPGAGAIVLVNVGVAAVGISALPVHDGATALGGRYEKAPLVGVAAGIGHGAVGKVLMYVVAAGGVLMLVAAANSAMLGVSRLALALATHRQIPSGVGRLHPRFGTPWLVIAVASVLAGALVLPTDLQLLLGIVAFGAMLAFTIAHVSVIALRRSEPDLVRPYRIPGSVRVGGADLPVPALLGAVLSALGWAGVVVAHSGARWVGIGWMALGLALYVGYRRLQSLPLLGQVSVPERALRSTPEELEVEFGSILVPVFGNELDVDIIQTAGRLAGDEHDDLTSEGAVIEALWVFVVPMALPLDARLPDAQLQRARQALARAKAVGEEYVGVEVATATVRARRAGAAIVDQARRRGVEAIVLAAEPPSRIRGGALLGGTSGPLDDFVGDITKYVLRKAPCRVILTAAAETVSS